MVTTSYIENNTKPSEVVINEARHLWFLMLFYTMIISISNWYDARLVSLLGFTISPGALSFPISFLLSDIITEVYGYKNARRCIWVSLFFNVLFILFGQLVTHLPSPYFALENNAAFDKLFVVNIWIVCGSFASFVVSEPLNAYLISKLKLLFNGKYIGIRFMSSTIIASLVDSVLFVLIAFHTMVNVSNLIKIMLTIWILKSVIEIIGLPLSIRLAVWLKRTEQLDIYDNNTNFTLFSLGVQYKSNDNHYTKS